MLETEDGKIRFWQKLAQQIQGDPLIDLLTDTLTLEGDVIECGVYRGGSIFKIARAMEAQAARKTIYALDSFEGFPEDRVGKADSTLFRPARKLRSKFRLADDVPERINRFADLYGVSLEVVKGFFDETLPTLESQNFCFIHLDVDLYDSYRECLEFLYPRLVPGGIVVFDDYGSPKWPGAKLAVDEFFSDRNEQVRIARGASKAAWYVKKIALS